MLAIDDCTDLNWLEWGYGENLEKRITAITGTLQRRVEGLVRSVAYARSARTEQGKPFTVYTNGYIKPEGMCPAVKIVAGDMGADAQVAAIQLCAEENFDVILANKPTDEDLLIWRVEPQVKRALHPDSIHIYIYSRLAWDKLRG